MDTSIVTANSKAVYIYTLVDPFTGLVRYVGKATNPDVRFRRHIKDARDGKRDHKSNWIASILKKDAKPVLRIIETCGNDWKEREAFWISKYKRDGFDLTNSKGGGDGLEPCDETRKRMSEAKKGKPAHNKGKVTPPEVREKQSASAKAKFAKMTAAQKRQMVENALQNPPKNLGGWHHTEEAKAKISAAGMGNKRTLGYKHSEETKQKSSQARKGHTVSEETRRKIGEANRKKRNGNN